MQTSTKTAKATTQRRARCANCDELFPKNPKQPTQKFCSNDCRYEFHKHGSAFGPLKTRLEKLCLQTIKAEVSKLREELKAATQYSNGISVKNRIDELAEDILTK